jgi:hypothetical protein
LWDGCQLFFGSIQFLACFCCKHRIGIVDAGVSIDVPGGIQCRYNEKTKEEQEPPIKPHELEGLQSSQNQYIVMRFTYVPCFEVGKWESLPNAFLGAGQQYVGRE